MEYEDDGDTYCNWCTWNNPQSINNGNRRYRKQRTSRDHQDYRIKISLNTEKSPEDFRGLAVTENPVKTHG